MAYTVTVKTVPAQPIAAVRRRVRIGAVAQAFKPALDEVWAFLRAHPVLKPGHNLFLYHHPTRREDPMDVDFGVQIAGPFEGEGAVIAAATPAGEVACVTHVGPYGGLLAAHDAIHAWRARENRQFAGQSWEIYGDWSEDEAKLETEICYLLG